MKRYIHKKIIKYKKELALSSVIFDLLFLKKFNEEILSMDIESEKIKLDELVLKIKELDKKKKDTIKLKDEALKIRSKVENKNAVEKQLMAGNNVARQLRYQLELLKRWKK